MADGYKPQYESNHISGTVYLKSAESKLES